MNRLSITTRLILSFVAIILVSIVLVIVVSNRVVFNRFSDLVVRSGANFSRKVVPVLERYYEDNGSWDGVESVVFNIPGSHEAGMGRNRPENMNPGMTGLMITAQEERFILIDDDEVVFDSNPEGIPINNPDNLTRFGTPIEVGGERVGTFLVASTMGILSETQNIFIRRVNAALIWVGLISIFLVFVVAIWQSRAIINPLHQMAGAANRLAKGDYQQRVVVDRNDELGDVATAFNQMASELAHQEEIRRQLMADVAHELRTPLSILRIDLESMEDGLMDPNSENIRHLQREVSYLSNLVEDLRMLSLADAGDLKVEKSRIELNSLVREMVERQQNAAREKQINLSATYSDQEIFVLGDIQRLSQVMINLLSNAIQHTPAEHSIMVEINNQGPNSVISVTNTGSWILKEDLSRIFDRFFRVERSRNRDQGGSGLGLSIAHSLVEAHGGKIWAESSEGKSTTFKVSLPVLEAN